MSQVENIVPNQLQPVPEVEILSIPCGKYGELRHCFLTESLTRSSHRGLDYPQEYDGRFIINRTKVVYKMFSHGAVVIDSYLPVWRCQDMPHVTLVAKSFKPLGSTIVTLMYFLNENLVKKHVLLSGLLFCLESTVYECELT